MKRLIKWAALIVILSFSIASVISFYQSRERANIYQNSIDLIEAGEYREALTVLSELPEDYRDKVVLRNYAESRARNHAYSTHYLMQQIPDDYAGALSEEILAYKQQNHLQYEQIRKEMEEKSKNVPVQTEEQRLQEMYGSRYPKYGMSEKGLKHCILGKPVSVETCSDFYKIKISKRYRIYQFGESGKPKSGVITVRYWFYSDMTKEFIDLPVNNGYVDHGIYYDEDGVRWEFDEKGAVKKSAASYHSTGSAHHSSGKDPYNVHDYNEPEDFYEDWADDFDGYEDAEEYWENGGD